MLSYSNTPRIYTLEQERISVSNRLHNRITKLPGGVEESIAMGHNLP